MRIKLITWLCILTAFLLVVGALAAKSYGQRQETRHNMQTGKIETVIVNEHAGGTTEYNVESGEITVIQGGGNELYGKRQRNRNGQNTIWGHTGRRNTQKYEVESQSDN